MREAAIRRIRVAFVTPCVPPVAVAESYVVLKRLRALAPHIDLTVISADDHAGYMGRMDLELEQFLPKSVRFVRVPIDIRGRVITLTRRVLELAMPHTGTIDLRGQQWVRRANEAAAAMDWFRGFDWLITDSSPVIAHRVGLEVLHHNPGIKWLQHYSDPFLDPIYAQYHALTRLLASRLARRLVEQASVISVPCAEMRDFMTAQWTKVFGLETTPPVLIVPHTYDEELFDIASRRYSSPFQDPPSRAKPFRISYIGHFYGKRSAAPLLRLVDVFREAGGHVSGRPVEFHLFGTVGWRDVRRIAEYPFVIRHRPVGYLASLAAMRESDALIVIDASATAGAVHFPSKLADYLGAGRPIIALSPPGSPTERIVRECGHLSVAPWVENRELEGVVRFCQTPPAGKVDPLRSARYENGTESVSALLDVLGKSSSSAVHE